MNKITTTIRVDWIFQTMMLAGILFEVIMAKPYDASGICTILLIWQFISAMVITALVNGRSPRRLLFLVGLIVYYLANHFAIQAELFTIGLPVALILCYWLLTTCNFYPSRDHKGKFLPHTSF